MIFRYAADILKVRSTQVLALLSLYAVSLSVFRVFLSGRLFSVFMFWNLFLAFIPWFAASLIYAGRIYSKTLILFLILVWLAFFPNAPYMLTDLVHLGRERSVPFWFDLILFLSYGFTGMLYGFVSLEMIERMIFQIFRFRHVRFFSALMIYVSCFGIYLGRFLRWNSWDLLVNPDNLLKDVLEIVFRPAEHRETWVFTVLFGTLLNMIFWSYRVFDGSRKTD